MVLLCQLAFHLLEPTAAAARATSEMATRGLEYGQGGIGSCMLAMGEEGVEEVEVVSEVRMWNDRLFWQSSRTATTELMEREMKRWGEVITEALRIPVGRWRTETELEWRSRAWSLGIKPT